ncbi:MAG: 30S ribosomal protein S17 [Acidimicrobiaceae bacterium]|nr:30S ribosomal protein S17 [Acidimicrobiaceae bacterium]
MSDITNNEENVEVEEAAGAIAETAAPEVETAVPEVETAAPEVETVTPEVSVEAAVEVEEAPAPVSVKPVVAEPERKGPVIKTPLAKESKATAVSEDDSRSNPRKVREGIVVSNKMDMTLVVAVNERVSHPRYGKTVQRTKKLYVHDEQNDAKIGDRVRVQETRPLSKLKRWRLTEVVERAR